MDRGGSKASAKLQNYLCFIPEQYMESLDEPINQEIICEAAKNLEGWDVKYYLLELDYDEVKDIKIDNSSAKSQR